VFSPINLLVASEIHYKNVFRLNLPRGPRPMLCKKLRVARGPRPVLWRAPAAGFCCVARGPGPLFAFRFSLSFIYKSVSRETIAKSVSRETIRTHGALYTGPGPCRVARGPCRVGRGLGVRVPWAGYRGRSLPDRGPRRTGLPFRSRQLEPYFAQFFTARTETAKVPLASIREPSPFVL